MDRLMGARQGCWRLFMVLGMVLLLGACDNDDSASPNTSPPVIGAQPEDVEVVAGSTAGFSVEASGVPTPAFQWQLSTDNGATWSDIAGATSAVYETPATVATDDGNQYRVAISNSAGSVTSLAVTLTVQTVLTAAVAPVATNGNFSCALKADGTVACWGANGSGELGDGSKTGRLTPVAVSGLDHVVAVTTGGSHACALKDDGKVMCWGYNFWGQLGNDSFEDSSTPVEVSGLTNVVAIEAGNQHNCALRNNGAVLCWGYNANGQLGNDTTANSATPVAVSGLEDVIAITAGAYHSCALGNGGDVFCWGDNSAGALGVGTVFAHSTTALAVSGLDDAVAISAGQQHTCALKADGTAVCWGNNNTGALGDGSTTNSPVPVTVSGIAGASAIAAGNFFSCVALADGSAFCWGSNGYGQLGDGTGGDGTFTHDKHTPVAVSGLTGVAFIAAGNNVGCAILVGGTASCWGSNGTGQLGNGGDPATSPVPVEVSGGAVFWH